MRSKSDPECNGRKFVKIFTILEKYERNPSRLVPILQAVQEEYRYLPREVLTYVATALNISPARVFGVATFYSHFATEPRGKHVIRLCNGTACHVKDSIPILEVIRKRLKLEGKKITTDDMMFTVETVACLGCCSLAPVMSVNGRVYGKLDRKETIKILKEYRGK